MYHPNLSSHKKHGLIGVLLILALLISMSATLRAQDLIWSKRAGDFYIDFGVGIAIDGAGNSYVTGGFGTSATFGPGEANETTLSGINSEIFVAKYNANGALVWAKRAGGSGLDFGAGIAVDGSGNSYVTGAFNVSATFGPGEANETTLSGTQDDVFVAKYDASGALVWARSIGSSGYDVGRRIAIDVAGNSFATGRLDRQIFVSKYDASGTLLWTKIVGGGPGYDEGFGIAVDGIGNSYVTGFFNASVTFGPGEANQTTLSASGGGGMFVAKYNANGILGWAKGVGGSGSSIGYGIAVDAAGNSYLTGTIFGSVTFGPSEANEITLSGIWNEIFVAKYDGNGALMWAKRAGGSGIDVGLDIAVDGVGNSYVTGYFKDDSAIFGSGEANETTLSGTGDEEIFVAKYDGSGALTWAKSASGTGQDNGRGIAVDGAGNSYVTGGFSGSTTFGPGEANQTILSTPGYPGYADVFVMKLASGNTPPTANAGADQTVITATGSAQITLDGSGSNNPDGDPLTYVWEITATPTGSNATLSNPSTVNPTFVADVAGEYTISLTVNDGTVNSAADEVIITAITAQQAIGSLIEQINALVASGDLEANQAKPLTDKLTAIIALLDKDKTEVAINQLETFINMVSSDINSGKLTLEQGQPLIDAANAIIAALRSGGALPKNASLDFSDRTGNSPPAEFRLEQNSPNPFNPVTAIQFSVPRESYVRLKVYNAFGAEVATLVDQQVAAGTYKVNWDASRLASGFYLCRLEAEGFAQTKKLLLMK